MHVVGQEQTLSRRQRRFLREAARLSRTTDDAAIELRWGVGGEDMERAFRALRRVVALGALAKDLCDEHRLDLTKDSA